MINKIVVGTPSWTLFCWNEHVRLFRSILDSGGIESATPKIARAYNFQKKSLQEMGITESAGRVLLRVIRGVLMKSNLPGLLDISDCDIIGQDVMFVREKSGKKKIGFEVEFDLVRFKRDGHLVCSGICDGRSIQFELSYLYEQGRRVLDKYELEHGVSK